ncbi:hypothetical protein, partial [Heyndrickxia coagulans]|uniref:hypothetical protein n=1 Tax=Heyndrickxia coagulans TaxID=1398 RepID=UPI001F2DB8DA
TFNCLTAYSFRGYSILARALRKRDRPPDSMYPGFGKKQSNPQFAKAAVFPICKPPFLKVENIENRLKSY